MPPDEREPLVLIKNGGKVRGQVFYHSSMDSNKETGDQSNEKW
jgi:hypothetical protein